MDTMLVAMNATRTTRRTTSSTNPCDITVWVEMGVHVLRIRSERDEVVLTADKINNQVIKDLGGRTLDLREVDS